jgi:hypothetical protein
MNESVVRCGYSRCRAELLSVPTVFGEFSVYLAKIPAGAAWGCSVVLSVSSTLMRVVVLRVQACRPRDARQEIVASR